MSERKKSLLKLIKNGYNEIALTHDNFTDKNISSLAIFLKFVSLSTEGKYILDLGCGSGSAVSEYFFEKGFSYLGIDLSEEQISLARKRFANYTNNFQVNEMLHFCQSIKENTFDGIIALFSIFHLPKEDHIILFQEIKRILKENAPILFTAFDSSDEGMEENWLGGTKQMFWSNHPYTWYESELMKIGFNKIETFSRNIKFANEDEIQYFLLFTG